MTVNHVTPELGLAEPVLWVRGEPRTVAWTRPDPGHVVSVAIFGVGRVLVGRRQGQWVGLLVQPSAPWQEVPVRDVDGLLHVGVQLLSQLVKVTVPVGLFSAEGR